MKTILGYFATAIILMIPFGSKPTYDFARVEKNIVRDSIKDLRQKRNLILLDVKIIQGENELDLDSISVLKSNLK